MNQSLMGRTSARWIVKGLLVLLLAAPGAGLALTAYNGHGPKMAPGGCGGCRQHLVIVASGSGTQRFSLVSSPELPAKQGS